MKRLLEPYSCTYTYSKSTESHVNTEKHGECATEGYSEADFSMCTTWADQHGVSYQVYDLAALSETGRSGTVLVLRNAIDHLTDALSKEFEEIVWKQLDRRMVNFTKVCRKYARGNAEIGPTRQESLLSQLPLGTVVKKGRTDDGRVVSGIVLSYDEVPCAKAVADTLPDLLGPKATGLRAEVNFYGPKYGPLDAEEEKHLKQMTLQDGGIGFHGDSERPDVVGILIATAPKELHFQAYRRRLPVGKRVVITLRNGDVYIMDADACGHAWVNDRRRDVVHYRHAAGCVGGNRFTR